MKGYTYQALCAVFFAACLSAKPAQATVILSTDFDDRVVSGATASNFTWVTNGVANPGNLTASHPLFDTPDAQDLFAVDRNLHNEGTWTVDIGLTVGANAIALTTVALEAFIFNNAGAFQTQERDLDLTIALRDGADTFTIDAESVLDIYPNSSNAPTQGANVVFDLSGNILAASTSYILRLTADGQGNNAGIDDFAVSGDIQSVPEPSTLTMLGVSLVGIAVMRSRAIRRRKR